MKSRNHTTKNISVKRVNTGRNSYVLSKTRRYLELVLWFFRVSDHTHYSVLMDRIEFLHKHSGVKFVTLFLKEALRLIQHWKSGNPTTALTGGPRVASRRGLPLIIPGPLRLQLEMGDLNSLRAVLTIISIYRVFKYPSEPKLSTIVEPFKGSKSTLEWFEVRRIRSLFTPYIPEMVPRGRENLIPLRSAGPNSKISILGAPMDALAWLSAPKELLSSLIIISDYFKSSIAEKLHEEMDIVSKLKVKKLDKCREEILTYVPILGKLSLKREAAGKVRVFAIVDVWTQSVLKPIHELVYSILRNIPQDGTFDQSGPLSLLRGKLNDKSLTYSYDLSAATDRLPIDLQVQVLSQFLPGNGFEVASAWKCLLVDRQFWLKGTSYKYAVGQPMGALSSFGLLALTHHFIVQYAAWRIGRKGWFDMYALLGDDIVIADEAVAGSYHLVMTEYLGVDINLSKSLVSSSGIMEFAKRLVSPTEEFTPLGPGNVMNILKYPSQLPSLFLDFLGKGGANDWSEGDVQKALLTVPSSVLRISREERDTLLWSIVGPFGFIEAKGFTTNLVVDSLEDVKYYDLTASVDECLLYFYSKDWDTAFNRSLVATLGVWKKAVHPDFLSEDGLPLNPHTFPSYRDLALEAIESLIEIGESRPLKPKKVDPFSDEEVFQESSEEEWQAEIQRLENEAYYGGWYGYIPTSDWFNEKVKSAPSIVPYDNPWMKPKVNRPRISRLGIKFFKRVQHIAIANSKRGDDDFGRDYLPESVWGESY